MSEEMVTITKKEYEKLLGRDNWLCCLEGAGVDNWDGYDYASELLEECEK
jgi:hypothetical protein